VEIPAHLLEFVEKSRPFLLTVSGLEKEYGIGLQIEALERILEKFPNAGLMILGWGSLEKELRELIASKKYRENILLAGDINHQMALHLIDKADILLRPTYYDGDAISVREALFLQTPVVATDNGMRPPGVNLIPFPPRIETLVEKIIELLAKNSGQKTANNRSVWENANGLENIEAVLDVYERLMKK
jgi:glycosyltransferase involved in cell wall biosynthesis